MHGSPEPDLTLLIPPDVPDDVQADAGRELLYSGEVFGTTWSLTLVRKAKTEARNDRAYIAQLAKACEQTLALIDDQMSLWREGSTIARYNALPPGHSAVLPEPISIVVGKALAVCERTNGAFSPGLYEAVERWGFGAAELEDPVASGLEYARARSSLSASQSTPCPQLRDGALERPEGFALDLNGIAKGYAVDLLCDVVRSHPDTAACLVEIGGELKGYGTRADGMPFWTDLAPDGDPTHPSYRVALYGWACATSGEAERCHRIESGVYSHILDPQTHASAKTDLVAATVFDKECAMADALATALIVMGAQDALSFANLHNIPCILTPRQGRGDHVSHALKAWV